VHAAEAGIDAALEVLQSEPRASLPCGTPLARSLGGGTTASDFLVTFTYYAAYPIAGAPMTCPLASEPAAVVLRSDGDSSDPIFGRRSLEVTARLTVPTGLGAFDRAVLSDTAIEYDGPVFVAGNGGDDAIIQTNAAFNCDQPQQLAGSVYAQGTATLSSSCSANRDVWAAGAVSMSGAAMVGHDLTSAAGAVTVGGTATVHGDARAGTTVTVDPTASVLGLQLPNSPSNAPPTRAFPNLPYDAGAWASSGYTPKNYSNCATALSELTTQAHTWASATIVRITGCRLDTTSATSIGVNGNLAIVAEQGFNLAAASSFTAVSANPRLHLIVPHGSSCVGTAGRIEMGAGMTFAPALQVFAYTPCLLQATNSGTLHGQLYGGAVRFGTFHMAYRPVDAVPGYTPVTLSVARRVAMVDKREVAG
jgi:hypothetical protein